MSKNNSGGLAGLQCGCYLLILAFNITIGTICTNYLIQVFFEKTIPLVFAAIIGLVGAELIVPGAIIVWLLKALGVF